MLLGRSLGDLPIDGNGKTIIVGALPEIPGKDLADLCQTFLVKWWQLQPCHYQCWVDCLTIYPTLPMVPCQWTNKAGGNWFFETFY